MAAITFIPSDAYPTISGATVSYGSGQTFDIKAALTAGTGSFSVDDGTQRALLDALDRHPAVKRQGGGSPGAPAATRTIGPVVAPNAPVGGGVLTSAGPGTLPDWSPPSVGSGSGPAGRAGQGLVSTGSAWLPAYTQATFRDNFNRSDRPLSGDIAPNGLPYYTTGAAVAIANGVAANPVGSGAAFYLYQTLPEVPGVVWADILVTAGTGATPTLMIGCNDPAQNELGNVVHCITTDGGIAIQVLDGIGGGAIVTLQARDFDQQAGGAVSTLPPGRYRVSIRAIGNTLVMQLASRPGTPMLTAKAVVTDSRIGAFWNRRTVWEIYSAAAGGKNMVLTAVGAGPLAEPANHGALHGGATPADPIVVELRRDVGAADQPAFQNGWLAFGGGFLPPSFYKDPFGRVYLGGNAKSGTLNATAFTLPAGYWPVLNPAASGAAPLYVLERFYPPQGGYLDVQSNGNVFIGSVPSNAIVSLGGVNFRGA